MSKTSAEALRSKNTGGRPEPSSSGCNSTKTGRGGCSFRLRDITYVVGLDLTRDVHPPSVDVHALAGPEVKPHRDGGKDEGDKAKTRNFSKKGFPVFQPSHDARGH